jgi:flagellar motor switch protein FliM
MADVLDQAGIDALMSAVSTGQVREPGRGAQIFSAQRKDLENIEIRDYDFKRPERIAKDQMRTLRTLHETFARGFGAAMSGFLRTIVEVRVASADQLAYGEFIASLPNPTAFSLIEAPPLEGQFCLEISPLIIYPVIDRLLGGSSEDVFIPQRPMTLIETRLIQRILARGMAALGEAWASVRKIDFRLGQMESNPHIVQIVPPNEVVVVIGFEIKLGTRGGTMSLCIPFTVIEPLMPELTQQSWFQPGRGRESAQWSRLIGRRLADAPLELTAILAESTITVRELRSLEVGDLIMTEKAATDPVLVLVGRIPKFLGGLGQHRGNRAVRVLRAIQQSDRVQPGRF